MRRAVGIKIKYIACLFLYQKHYLLLLLLTGMGNKVSRQLFFVVYDNKEGYQPTKRILISSKGPVGKHTWDAPLNKIFSTRIGEDSNL